MNNTKKKLVFKVAETGEMIFGYGKSFPERLNNLWENITVRFPDGHLPAARIYGYTEFKA